MSDVHPQAAEPSVLVPHRACGECNVCCHALTIDDPEMQKPQGYRCKNTLPNKGCAIYETRPNMCRTFFCGWRSLKWIREPLRPDLSGVLIRRQFTVMANQKTPVEGVIFTLLTHAALKAEGLAETIGAAVTAGIPVYLHVLGPPGYTSSQARIDEALRPAVLARDKATILEILRRAQAQGRQGPRVAIKMKHGKTNAGDDR
jgi:hypothetical protein